MDVARAAFRHRIPTLLRWYHDALQFAVTTNVLMMVLVAVTPGASEIGAAVFGSVDPVSRHERARRRDKVVENLSTVLNCEHLSATRIVTFLTNSFNFDVARPRSVSILFLASVHSLNAQQQQTSHACGTRFTAYGHRAMYCPLFLSPLQRVN